MHTNEGLAQKFDKIIFYLMLVYVFGSPFSISLAQLGLVPAVLLWLFKAVFINKGKFYGTFIDIGIIICLLGELITSIFCEYPASAFSGYQGEWQIITIWLLLNSIKVKEAKKLINVLFVASTLTAIYGIYQYFSGWDIVRHRELVSNATVASTYNIVGGFGLHLTYGGFFMMVALVGLSLAIIYYKDDIKKFWMYVAGTSIIIFSVYGTFARSAWIGFIAGLLTFIFLKSRKFFVIFVVFLTLFIILLYNVNSVFHYKVSSLEFENIKKSYRWQIWTIATRIINDHRLIGVGNGNFIKYYDKYKDKGWREKIGHPHNDFLNIYLTSGIIGFVGYMLIWILLSIKAIKFIININDTYTKNIMIGLFSGIVSFLVAGLGQCYFTDSENSMLLWLFIGLIMVFYYDKNEKQRFIQIKRLIRHK